MIAPLHPAEADEYADLLVLIEDWLRHASDETLAELADFAPGWRGADRIIDDLTRVSIRLRQLAEVLA